MELKKVWMSPDTKKKSKYGYRAVGGILGIVLLMVLLLCGGTLLSLSFMGYGCPRPVQSWEWVSWLCRWYDGNTGVFAPAGPPAVYSQPCGRNFEGVKYQGEPQPLRSPMPGASSRYACDPVYLSSDQRRSRRGHAAAGAGAQEDLGECVGARWELESAIYSAGRSGPCSLCDHVRPEPSGCCCDVW